ncbi:bacteriocin fulvocin C-related protein [Nannocystis pusilla]|uniref:bacteriocin fulvocin C-related protein n=1 Tax=Nannocystis pusilla TaxID=889268 RepID=UPI003B80307E
MQKENRTNRGFMVAAGLTGMLLGLPACMDGAEQHDRSIDQVEAAIVSDDTAPHWAGAIPTAEDCDSITAWIAANEANLPVEYDDLIRFPEAYRGRISAALSPAQRTSLWRQHFQAYQDAHPELSAEQAAFIDKAAAMTSPEFFTGGRRATMAALESEAKMLFPEDRGYGVLARLGLDDPSGSINTPAPRAETQCTCATDSDWCDSRWDCKHNANDCVEIKDACGSWNAYHCNGMCGRI